MHFLQKKVRMRVPLKNFMEVELKSLRSPLMRNIEASAWLTAPHLIEVKTARSHYRRRRLGSGLAAIDLRRERDQRVGDTNGTGRPGLQAPQRLG